ncbi:hypothetical protein ACI2VP_05005 [Ralstonia nicotianae]|uniref:phage protein n=1 Tax=Ralstonia nicotianae TaxID=3037696 RepID=UPI000370308E
MDKSEAKPLKAYIAECWEDPDDVEPGWFETAEEADDEVNCWRVEPTHWMPLPEQPKAAMSAALEDEKNANE